MLMEDLDRVLQIESEAYPVPWSRLVFEDCVKGSNECWVATIAGEICGYAIVSNILDEVHLLNLCIDPRNNRRGYGRTLLRKLIARSVSRGASVFFLEVRVSNRAAISLYFSEGFNEVGIRKGYYPSRSGAREDAIVMTLDLSIDCTV